MSSVDLNCDMGESFGAWSIGNDLAVLPFVSSVNIACGFHAGDPSVMRRTVLAALAHGVSIGAHPGLPDLVGFGRREMTVSASDVYDLVTYQVGALTGIAGAAGAQVRHVKPHGALYNMAAVQPQLADAIARAIRDVNPALALVGLSGSSLITAGLAHGLHTISEVFADRMYMPDGTLVSRSRSDAHVPDVTTAVARAVAMVTTGTVAAIDGSVLAIVADSICIHGDGPDAAEIAERLNAGLRSSDIRIAAPVHT
jgi:5-oxoprolinase (ATP-hydrolysing) subunit A